MYPKQLLDMCNIYTNIIRTEMCAIGYIRQHLTEHTAQCAISEAHKQIKGVSRDPWLAIFLFPVIRDIEKLFLVTRNWLIPRYTWLQYIILRDTGYDVLFPVIWSHVLNKNTPLNF